MEKMTLITAIEFIWLKTISYYRISSVGRTIAYQAMGREFKTLIHQT